MLLSLTESTIYGIFIEVSIYLASFFKSLVKSVKASTAMGAFSVCTEVMRAVLKCRSAKAVIIACMEVDNLGVYSV